MYDLYEVQKQMKLINGDRDENNSKPELGTVLIDGDIREPSGVLEMFYILTW